MLSSYLAAIGDGDGDGALKASVSAHAFKCHTRCAEYIFNHYFFLPASHVRTFFIISSNIFILSFVYFLLFFLPASHVKT
jgi:hypothetical protein